MDQVRPDRMAEAHEIDPGMGIEGLVLSREERVLDELGDGADRHEDPFFGRVFGQEPPVARQHARHRRRIVIGQLPVVRKPLREVAVEQEGPEHARQRQRNQPGKQRGEDPHGMRAPEFTARDPEARAA